MVKTSFTVGSEIHVGCCITYLLATTHINDFIVSNIKQSIEMCRIDYSYLADISTKESEKEKEE